MSASNMHLDLPRPANVHVISESHSSPPLPPLPPLPPPPDFHDENSDDSPPIRFIDLEDLKRHGSLPRFPDHHNIVKLAQDLDRNDTFFVYISHRWMRSTSDAEGYDGSPHPDNADNGKYKLIIEGVDRAWKTWASGMGKCCVWIDFCCVNQNKYVLGELQQLTKIFEFCDCMFTPILDNEWEMQQSGDNYGLKTLYSGYKPSVWHEGQNAYLNRSWCRLEMILASHLDLASTQQQRNNNNNNNDNDNDNDNDNNNTYLQERRNNFSAGLQSSFQRNLRPHLLYGPREGHSGLPPIMLPPLHMSFIETHHPSTGFSTKETDKVLIARLMSTLTLKRINKGYEGDRNELGQMHGKGRYVFSDGDVYEGEWDSDRRHGQGTMSYHNGNIIEGTWINNRIEGLSKIRYANGDVYQGFLENDVANGIGKLLQANGNIYEGGWRQGRKHGEGVFVWCKEGARYDGQWQNDKREGKGKLTLSDGEAYEGDWLDDLKHSEGRYVWPDGETYEGSYKFGKKHGYGVYKYISGARYEGDWKDDKKNGKGTFYFANGSVYNGQYKNGYQHGEGKMQWSDGSVYQGGFRNDHRHGNGVFQLANGDIYEGSFQNDKMQGFGKLKFTNGDVYEGEFENGKRHGLGRMECREYVYIGEWSNGKMNGQGMMTFSGGDKKEGTWVNDVFRNP